LRLIGVKTGDKSGTKLTKFTNGTTFWDSSKNVEKNVFTYKENRFIEY
jgi:hypothetical protein